MIAGVMGLSHDTTEEQTTASEALGRAIAKSGAMLLTGATSGLPFHAAKAAKQAGGTVIGISPAADKKEHVEVFGKPTEYHDIIIYTGLGLIGRNAVNIRSSDAVFILAGHIGTLNEFTIAFQMKKPIGVLTGIGGIADSIAELCDKLGIEDRKIIFDDDPERLVKMTIGDAK